MLFEKYDQYVLEIVEAGSFVRAAKRLNISQAAISMGVKVLENRLGYSLFHRDVNPIKLTREGEVYYKYLLKYKENRKDLDLEIDELKESQEQSLSIGSPLFYLENYVVPIVTSIKNNYPKAKIEILSGENDSLKKLLSEGKINGFICLDEKEKNGIKVASEQLCLYYPKKWEGKNKQVDLTKADLNTIQDKALIVLHESMPLQKYIDDFVDAKKIRIQSRITTNQIAIGIQLVQAGVGMFIAPNKKDIDDSIRCVTLPGQKYGRDIFYVRNNERYLSRIESDFINELKRSGGMAK
ncbi:MAG: LysR family transcriptional regulator [Solobacterium sp.]|nr:LysR family transcriptional regulator [Solobacterium sp.]